MSYLTVPLESGHQKKDFNCGTPLLNNYLHTQAKQDVKRKLATCFVLVENKIVKGYYTLSSASVSREALSEKIKKKLPPSYTYLPVTLLGRLAVDVHYKGKGLGELLLLDALKRCYEVAVFSIGSMAVVVDPIDDTAKGFYSKYGFIHLPGSGKMFIPIEMLSSLFK